MSWGLKGHEVARSQTETTEVLLGEALLRHGGCPLHICYLRRQHCMTHDPYQVTTDHGNTFSQTIGPQFYFDHHHTHNNLPSGFLTMNLILIYATVLAIVNNRKMQRLKWVNESRQADYLFLKNTAFHGSYWLFKWKMFSQPPYSDNYCCCYNILQQMRSIT